MSSMDITRLQPRAEEAAQLLAAMANPKRLLILCNLLDRERTVSELAAIVDLEQSPLSQHLARLRAMGLVHARRNGQSVHYSLASAEVTELLETLYRIYCEPEERARASEQG
ncbi:metalloregulator ArsR/SmtB family transcription factor [Devosia sp. ZB163]|uniref:ArsR/SmtB family transcription factor n=1 Tax=Devosia sp. ZB163 TaxID=3025938 RepID=UPI00235DE5DD|nr:metalloregulator ArsR/SmtB family transcription factor [Devosia sp. ZB163]MDC9823692.1 metalloregulator ArsR/SmtB family transcription factor [Devosia sp. ZB163]